MFNDTSAVTLVDQARNGNKAAWDQIVERYTPLVWSICRRYRLATHDADDVGQSVWLRLIEHLSDIRDPGALPGWLATTTRRECLRLLRAAGRRERSEQAIENDEIAMADLAPVDQMLLQAERELALREAFAQLPPRCQRLLSLLLQDPPLSYEQVSQELGMPVGGIGPNRGRCLAKLRRCPALAALSGDVTKEAGKGGRCDEQMVDR